MRRRGTIVLGVATAAAAVGLVLRAQDQLPQPTFRTEANYVRVDLYPSRNGVPVLDLAGADFEVREDRALQKIEQFEHVVIRAAGSGEGRPEPNTVAESRQAIQDPRARVFVVFLDPKHVDLSASRQIGQPMVGALNRLIGPDDYVGVLKPGMPARDVTFARRTTAIENVLKRDWWGERDRLMPSDDPVEKQYFICYGAANPEIAQEMILRRREQQTLDALEDLAVFLRGVREERKAVLAISDGWLLYRRNANLERPLDQPPPSPLPLAGVDPRSGKLTTKDTQNPGNVDLRTCELDRHALSELDDYERISVITDEANRSNVSIYPIDPRGLVVFDESIVPAGVGAGPPPATLPLVEENARLTARAMSLRRLADGTDGTALVGTNNIAAGLRRITDDLSSYYLLGYYSTGKLDGRFHSISVRVTRPGVTVRARRGYLAPKPADLKLAPGPRPLVASSDGPAEAAGRAMASAASVAVARLPGAIRDQPFRIHAVAGWRPAKDGPDRPPAAVFWAVGEVADRIPGSDVDVVVVSAAGETVATARGRIAPGTTAALISAVPDANIGPGEYTVRVRGQGPNGVETLSMPVTLQPAPQASGPIFIRRGPLTGNKEVPTADLRFRRSERLRVEIPSAADATSARLLDRTGKATPVPVASASRSDADGVRWSTAELALAPLAPADYLIELTAGDSVRTLVAFRVVP